MPLKIDKLRLTRAQDRRTKLSDEQVAEIINLYSKGFTQKSIANKFGVRQNTISFLVDTQSPCALGE